MHSDIITIEDRLSESVQKLLAVADLLGSTDEERVLSALTLPWVARLISEELQRMDRAIGLLGTLSRVS